MDEYNRYGESLAEETVNGYTRDEILTFVGNNGERYYNLFQKNEGKKIFFHMNWSACIFSLYWMFYRKMYVEGILYFLLTKVIVILSIIVALFLYRGEFLALQNQIQNYNNIVEQADTTGELSQLPDLFLAGRMEHASKVLTGKMTFIALIPSLILWVGFGLVADCLYRRYMLKKIRFTNGGTSGTSILIALGIILASNAADNLLLKWIVSLILK